MKTTINDLSKISFEQVKAAAEKQGFIKTPIQRCLNEKEKKIHLTQWNKFIANGNNKHEKSIAIPINDIVDNVDLVQWEKDLNDLGYIVTQDEDFFIVFRYINE